jgi:hypothetical protein
MGQKKIFKTAIKHLSRWNLTIMPRITFVGGKIASISDQTHESPKYAFCAIISPPFSNCCIFIIIQPYTHYMIIYTHWQVFFMLFYFWCMCKTYCVVFLRASRNENIPNYFY